MEPPASERLGHNPFIPFRAESRSSYQPESVIHDYKAYFKGTANVCQRVLHTMFRRKRQEYGAEAEKTYHLKQALIRANEEIHHLSHRVNHLEIYKVQSEIERNSFYLVMKTRASVTTRLEKSLETANDKIRVLESQLASTVETNSQGTQSEDLHLLEHQRLLEEKMAKAQLLNQQEKEGIAREYEAKLLDEAIQNLDLTLENQDLCLRFAETTELLAGNESWQETYEALKEKTTRDLAIQREALEALRVKYLEMATEVKTLKLHKISETPEVKKSLCSDNADLEMELNKQLEAAPKLLKHWRDGIAQIQKHQKEEKSQIVDALQRMKDEMTNKNQMVITKMNQLEEENTLLENICLSLKKKKRGIFGRMQDRQSELDKMKRRMQEEETKRSKRDEKKTRESAGIDALQTAS